MQAEKEYTGPQIYIVPLIFQRLYDDYQCLILVFSVIYLDLWGYIGWGLHPGIWKVSFSIWFSSFSFFFSFLFVTFFFPLSWGPFSSAKGYYLDIYSAQEKWQEAGQKFRVLLIDWRLKFHLTCIVWSLPT